MRGKHRKHGQIKSWLQKYCIESSDLSRALAKRRDGFTDAENRIHSSF